MNYYQETHSNDPNDVKNYMLQVKLLSHSQQESVHKPKHSPKKSTGWNSIALLLLFLGVGKNSTTYALVLFFSKISQKTVHTIVQFFKSLAQSLYIQRCSCVRDGFKIIDWDLRNIAKISPKKTATIKNSICFSIF